jgi:hypothetical protein
VLRVADTFYLRLLFDLFEIRRVYVAKKYRLVVFFVWRGSF